jgi:hypothetical protein
MLPRLCFWPLAALLLTGCFFDPGACVYKVRSIELTASMAGSALRPGQSPATAMISLNESRDGGEFRTLDASIQTQAAAAISLVELRQTTPTGSKVLATFPLGQGQSGSWYASVELGSASPTHEMLALAARLGELSVFAQVGIAGNLGALAGKLGITSETGWNHPRCD